MSIFLSAEVFLLVKFVTVMLWTLFWFVVVWLVRPTPLRPPRLIPRGGLSKGVMQIWSRDIVSII